MNETIEKIKSAITSLEKEHGRGARQVGFNHFCFLAKRGRDAILQDSIIKTSGELE